MQKYTVTNIDNIAKQFYPVGLIEYTKKVAIENNDKPVLITTHDCERYINKFCNNLTIERNPLS